eukprot:scaffold41946_cov62-Phaeocystis_antarctica.AAC.1
MGGDRCYGAAHHCVYVCVGGVVDYGIPSVGENAVVPRGGCSIIRVSEVELPPPLLREALDERDRGSGVLDSHVALVSTVALRWERGMRQHRAAAH